MIMHVFTTCMIPSGAFILKGHLDQETMCFCFSQILRIGRALFFMSIERED